MKKVLVATSVLALFSTGITGASADPASRARANAYGIDAGGSLLEGLIEREPEVFADLPPGEANQDDVLDADLEPIARDAVAFVQAETSAESTIVPVLRPDSGDDGGGEVLGDVLGDVIGGGEGGGDGGGGLIGDVIGDVIGDGGGDGEENEDISFPGVNARGFAIVDLTAAVTEDDGGGGEDGAVAGVTGDAAGDGGGGEDGAVAGVTGDAAGDGGGGEDGAVAGVTGDAAGDGGAGTADTAFRIQQIGDEALLDIVVDALLSIQVIQAEAVAVCTGNTIEFDTASRLIDDQGSDIEVADVLDDVVSGVLEIVSGDEGVLRELIEITEGSDPEGSGTTADGGRFVNGLRIRILPGGDGEGGVIGDVVGDVVGDVTGGGDDGGDDGGDESDALVDITLAHAEVSGNAVCAQQAAPPTPLPPAGDRETLPVTGGALGVLPAVLGLGLAGGALAAGRVALRSRRENNL